MLHIKEVTQFAAITVHHFQESTREQFISATMLPKTTADTATKWELFGLNEHSLIQSPSPAKERFPWLLVRFWGEGLSGTAGVALGLLQQGGEGRAWQWWQPHLTITALISHPDCSRLRMLQWILLAATITVSVGAFRKETLCNILPCVYPAFN